MRAGTIKMKNIPLDIDMLHIMQTLQQKYSMSFTALMRLAILDPVTFCRYHNAAFPPEMHKATAARAWEVLPGNYSALHADDQAKQEAEQPAAPEPEMPRPFKSRPTEMLQKDLQAYLSKPKLTETQQLVKERLEYELRQRGLSVA